MVEPQRAQVDRIATGQYSAKSAQNLPAKGINRDTGSDSREVGANKILHCRVQQSRRNLREQLPIALVCVCGNLLRGESNRGGHIGQDTRIELGKVAGIKIRMSSRTGRNVYRRNVVIALIGRKEPRLTQF